MLNLLTATQAEAGPLISALKLKKIPAALPCYQSDDFYLIVSGIGKVNCATACGWLAAKTNNTGKRKPTAWLNVGIAGHKSRDFGSFLVAHKITELVTDKVWFPHRVLVNLPSSDLITVDKPQDYYLDDHLHDMEASAFIESARRFSDAELVQCLKIVSDNEDHPIANINAKLASKLTTDNIELIVDCCEQLQLLAQTTSSIDTSIATTIRERWHFSVSQTVQLERLLQKYQVIRTSLAEVPEEMKSLQSSKDVLRWLTNAVENT